jgi:hypothetical protein
MVQVRHFRGHGPGDSGDALHRDGCRKLHAHKDSAGFVQRDRHFGTGELRSHPDNDHYSGFGTVIVTGRPPLLGPGARAGTQ